ncbi:hypothetical protein Y032_0064g3525 [Ancylostoma ceylanicum]|uniref:Uncharacterized protein n=1 Tax=Ancylostoma ceylanicum TaxID=53326 RepID=A0A016U1N8_9BILA|nr:hypothetical protein Y032_0064g3525 [Ancylostoma ceylanicum]
MIYCRRRLNSHPVLPHRKRQEKKMAKSPFSHDRDLFEYSSQHPVMSQVFLSGQQPYLSDRRIASFVSEW